jgi:hypothetical protein
LPVYEYTCPIHRVVSRRREAIGNSFLRCRERDESGEECRERLRPILVESIDPGDPASR